MFGRNKDGQEITNSLEPAVLQQIAEVASEMDQPITAAQVGAVFAARQAILEGDALGTVMKGQDGEIAVRVNDNGLHMWRVTCTDGTIYNNTEPKLPADIWTKV